MPRAPKGFQVSEYETGLRNPRKIVTAPNGDIFVAESGPGRIKRLRDTNGDGKADASDVFATGLTTALRDRLLSARAQPTHVYVGQYRFRGPVSLQERRHQGTGPAGDRSSRTSRAAASESAAAVTGLATCEFSADGKTLFVSVGSRSNVSDDDSENRRADILAFDPDGSNERIYASGIRNAVGLAIHPQTGQLWCSVNERDGLGDHLVPDYVTHVEEGGFYGWPWYYIGPHQDPRHKDKHPELKDKVIVPDVLVQSHSASLCMTFYTGEQFPRNIDSMPSPPSTARGTAQAAPATRSSASRSRTARRPANTKIFSSASSPTMATSGAARWASPWPRTALFW